MNGAMQRILTTLRDGGSLSRDVCRSLGTLRTSDGTEVCNVRGSTIYRMVTAELYLAERPQLISRGVKSYDLTPAGLALARTIRNRRKP